MYASFLFNGPALQEAAPPVVHLPVGGTPSPEVTAEMMAEPEATVVLSTPTTLVRVAARLAALGASLSSVRLFLFAVRRSTTTSGP